MTFADAHGRTVSQDELQVMAYTDPLTGLGNQHRLSDKINALISERADDPAPFTIGIANLDGFKPINDLFGPIPATRSFARSPTGSRPASLMARPSRASMATNSPSSCR